MRQRLTILFGFTIMVVSVLGQNNNDSLGEKRAGEELKSALTDTTQHNAISSKFIVLNNEEKSDKIRRTNSVWHLQ
jgi:hypothetical protein